MTESLTGEVSYGDRAFTSTFVLKPPRSGWAILMNEVRSYLNGRVRTLVGPDDANYYYTGRFKTSLARTVYWAS